MNNQTQNEPSNKRKRMMVLAATSVALIGGGLYSASLLNAPSKIATQSSSGVSKEKRNLSDLDKVKEAQKKNKKEENRKTGNDSPLQTLDTLNDQVSLDKILEKDNPAIKNTQKLVDKISESTDGLSDIIQSALGKKKTQTQSDNSEKLGKLEKSDSLNEGKSEELVVPLPVPSPTPQPDIPDPVPNPIPDPEPTPNPDPNPDPNPTPDPTPSIDELIAQSKEALTTAAEKAEVLNEQLLTIQSELTHLQAIESDTEEKATLAEEQWSKVEQLVHEYQSISAELQALIEADGSIIEANQAIYQTTYEKLTNKVNELKEARQQANKTTNTMKQAIEQAGNTLNTLDATRTDYQEKQLKVTTVTNDTIVAVNNAQTNSDVANAVQPEIDQANEATNHMNTTNQAVGTQLNTIDQQTSQDAIDSAKQTADAVNDVAVQQNEAVDTAINEFNTFPTPPTENNVPTVPANAENAEQMSSTADTQTSVNNTDNGLANE